MGEITDLAAGLILLVGGGAVVLMGLNAYIYNKIEEALPPPQTVVGTVLEENDIHYSLGYDEYLLTIDTLDGQRMIITYNDAITPGGIRDIDALLVEGDKVKLNFAPYTDPDCEPTLSSPCKTTLYGLDAKLIDDN